MRCWVQMKADWGPIRSNPKGSGSRTTGFFRSLIHRISKSYKRKSRIFVSFRPALVTDFSQAMASYRTIRCDCSDQRILKDSEACRDCG